MGISHRASVSLQFLDFTSKHATHAQSAFQFSFYFICNGQRDFWKYFAALGGTCTGNSRAHARAHNFFFFWWREHDLNLVKSTKISTKQCCWVVFVCLCEQDKNKIAELCNLLKISYPGKWKIGWKVEKSKAKADKRNHHTGRKSHFLCVIHTFNGR